MHKVSRRLSGIKTLSIVRPSARPKRNLMVPSADEELRTVLSRLIENSLSSRVRSPADRSVISVKELIPFWKSHL